MPPAVRDFESSRIVVGYDPAGRVDNTGIAVAIVHQAELGGRLETVYEIVDLQGLRLLWEDQHQYLAYIPPGTFSHVATCSSGATSLALRVEQSAAHPGLVSHA